MQEWAPQYVSCAICDLDNTRTLFRPRQSCGPVVQCRECGLVYVNPRESAPWLEQHARLEGDVSEAWDRPWFQRYLAEATWKRANFRRTVARLQELGLNGAQGSPKVLDFGCSIGLFLQLAAEAGWQASGVEPDTVVARYGQEVLGLSIFNGVLSEAGFPDGYFDATVSFQVFEHLPDPVGELEEIWRALRPEGLIALDVPSIDNVWYRLLQGRHRHFATPQHIYFYTPATMSKLLRKAGFEILTVDFPPRSLSLEHLCRHHVALYSQTASDLLLKLFSAVGGLDRTVSINLKDIICVYARKPA